MNTLPYVIMAFVTLQRLAELVIAARNTSLLRAQGAIEIGASHYPLMVALHGAWLIALWLSAGGRAVNLPLLAVFAMLQAARLWVLATLGGRWTTRIIMLPGAPLVTSGPFPVRSSPQLLRGGRRDCHPADGVWIGLDRSDIHGAKRRHVVVAHRRGAQRAVS